MGPRRRLFQLGLGRPGSKPAVDWEIEHHLAEQTEMLIGEGMDPKAARREAERRFGDLAKHRRRLVNMDRSGMMMRNSAEWNSTLVSMMAHAVRGIVRSPGLTLAVVITLGLGLGVNTVMFSVVDRLLLSPPDHVDQPDQLRRILVHGTLFGGERTIPAVTYGDVEDLRSIPEFVSVGATSSVRELTMGRGADAMRVRATKATSDYFSTLGVSPRQGRFFTAEDDRIDAAGTLVLSEGFWDRAFGGDGGVLGRTLEVDGHPYTVIGIAPRGFTGMDLAPVDLWLAALPGEFANRGDDGFVTSRGSYWLQAVARMAGGASEEVAQDRATALHLGSRADRIESGRFNPETYVLTAPLIQAQGPMASATAKTARWLGGVSLVVLLIACANVANLLLTQASRKRRETAVRLSLGASRPRLLGEIVLGGLLLSGLGGLAALALASGGGRLVQTKLLPDVLWSGSLLTGRVVGITLLLSVMAGLLAGLMPAFQSTRPNLSIDLKDGGRGGTGARSRTRTLLTVGQGAMSTILLVGAGLFLRSVTEVQALDLGLDADRLVLAVLETHGDDVVPEERTRLYQDAMDRLAGMPGVAGVAATNVPFQGYMRTALRLPGVDSLPIPQGVGPLFYSVTPGYLEVLGLDILRGRSLQETDLEGAPLVTVVNETMARSLWPDGEALGACLYFDGGEDCTTVVGVVEDASVGDIAGTQFLTYFLPMPQVGFPPTGLYVRAVGDVGEVAASIAPVLQSFSPSVRFASVRTLSQILDPQSRSWVMGAALFTAFGILALLVASVGLYSLLAFDVLQRTREIGIRTALGAERGNVLRGVLAKGGRMVALGCLIGVGVAFLFAPKVQPLLFNVSGRDPWVLAGVPLLLLAIGSLSSLPPALWATRIDPVEALRQE